MTSQTACDHCGLPVPEGLVDPSAEQQFCCSGCRLAWEIIHDHGLEGYYGLRQRMDDDPQAAQSTGRAFSEFDDPAFAKRYVRKLENGVCTVELYLEGIHCAACVWLVERIPVALPGVVEIRLDLGRSLAVATWVPNQVALSEIVRFLDRIGYAPHVFRGAATRDIERKEKRSLLIRIAVAGALTGNVMLMAFALYGGHFHGINETYRLAFRWISLALATPAVSWCALPFFRGAFGALRTRTLHMDLPIALGISAGFVQGAVNTVLNRGEIYFESVTALIFFLLVGRFIQTSQQRAAASASELLFSLSPATARRVRLETVEEVPVEALLTGDLVEIRPGETIPADGVISSGSSNLDRSLLTGESRPEPVEPGSPAHAGTLNITAPVLLRVENTGESTRVGRLMRLVEESARRKAPTILLADRLSGWFVAAVVLLAFGTFFFWLPRQPEQAVEHAVALLVVSCPCALGLATPLAISAALAAAARKGLLIKNGEALEVLARTGIMMLDKTGTVTEGKMRLVSWHGNESVKPLVSALESTSNHPIAAALVEDLEDVGDLQTTSVEAHSSGITGEVEGRSVVVGSVAYVLQRFGRALSPDFTDAVEHAAADSLTPVVIVVDGRAEAVACLGDRMRPEAPEIVAQLSKHGWDPRLLSGDHPKVVAAVAAEAGFDPLRAQGGISPEGKVEAIQKASKTDPVAMVGDGVNDAAALAAATVGIGVHGGAEVTLAAADIFIQRPGLIPVLELITGARRTMRVIRRNLIFSLTYNTIAAVLAMAGHMSPILAAILMPLSSITVVVSSYRSRSF